MTARRRRSRGPLALVVAAAVVAALAVGGVVAGLRLLSSEDPAPEGCVASYDGSTAHLAPDQAANAAMIAAIGTERGLPARAVTIALATAMQESRLRNLDHGDRDSVGLFQQRPSQGWGSVEQIMDPVYATTTFYEHLEQVAGYEDMEVTVAAQRVQRSGFPDAYAQHEPMARLFASALTGWSQGSLVCTLGSGAGASEADLAELLARDWPSAQAAVSGGDGGGAGAAGGGRDEGGSTTADRGYVLSASGTGDARATWALAQWAVATAVLTGATEVSVGDQAWSPGGGESGAWKPAADPVPAGQVRVLVGG